MTIVLDGQTLPEPNVPFLQKPTEAAKDVVTLGGYMYTDFTSRSLQYELNYARLDEADYTVIWDIYTSQFTDFDYPLLTIADYDIYNYPVRVIINDKDIRRDGCYIYGVTVTLILTSPVS